MSGVTDKKDVGSSKRQDGSVSHERRRFVCGVGWVIGAALAPQAVLHAFGPAGEGEAQSFDDPPLIPVGGHPVYLHLKDKVPDPQVITFKVQYPGKDPIKLVGHFWYNKETVESGRKCPAIVELNPYRRRDGMITVDSGMYPWFAYNEYLCFRLDLQGAGDSEGMLTDEYTDEELLYCTQVIHQIAEHPWCDGNVGMMGESWSAINSLMVASRHDCPSVLKAIIVNCGNDDRYGDDVHYMGGAMMQDNVAWPSSMWGWLALPPDPGIVGHRWKEMWRERIKNADFWFRQWATHQSRDSYWKRASVLDHYERVKIPVYIMSGWQDGYKNPVDRVVRGLAAVGMPVGGLIGPWGHSYPFRGFPGPRIDWLRYIVTHWWDKWLKGIEPPADTELPQLTAWLGMSKEPGRSSCPDDEGRWIAEDSDWPTRIKEKVFHLCPNKRLSHAEPAGHAECVSSGRLLFATTMLETSSYGSCGNNDLPGDQAEIDSKSLYFDSGPLTDDMDCFGHPIVNLTLACDKPLASIAVRLCEVSPETQSSHLVTYSFFNLCYRGDDMTKPQRIEPGIAFKVAVPLNLMGHTFKKGWRIRLSVSPSFFPTMWQSPEKPTITLHTGVFGDLPASTLVLPGRKPRPDDNRLKVLLPPTADVVSVDVEDYVPTTGDPKRPGGNTREVEHITVDGKKGILVKKVFDGGRYRYGGPLEELWVDQVAHENFQMLYDDPLSLIGFTSSVSILKRQSAGDEWKVKAETSTRVWTEKDQAGQYYFKYTAMVKTFIADTEGRFNPFEQKTVEGSIPRLWV